MSVCVGSGVCNSLLVPVSKKRITYMLLCCLKAVLLQGPVQGTWLCKRTVFQIKSGKTLQFKNLLCKFVEIRNSISNYSARNLLHALGWTVW